MDTRTNQTAKRLSRMMLGMSAAVMVMAGAVVVRAEPGDERPRPERRQGERSESDVRTGRPQQNGSQGGDQQRGPRGEGRSGDDQGPPPPRGPDRATLEQMAKDLGVTPEKLDEVLKKYRPSPRGENGRRGPTTRPEGGEGRSEGRGPRDEGQPPRGERRGGGDDDMGPPPRDGERRDGERREGDRRDGEQGPPRERGNRSRSSERTGQMNVAPDDVRDVVRM